MNTTKLISLIALIFISYNLVLAQKSSDDFVFTIKTANPGLTNSSSFHLNLSQPNINYLVDVDWNNDGVFDTLGVNNSISHDFVNSGIYTIRLKGQFPKLQFGNYKTNVSDRSKLISVDQWGSQSWSDVSSMFINCDSLLTTPLDTPDFSGIWALGSMFAGAEKFNSPINHWDISTITTTNVMFYGAESFNQPLNNWDVSSIVFASRMFTNAKSFNSSLKNWNLTSAIDLGYMFEGATSFNQSINSWNTPACTSMFSMFLDANNYNQPMDSINVSNVIDFGRMFENANVFNQDLSNWDFSNSAGIRWFLDNSNMSVRNYDKLLNHWFVNYSNKSLNVGSNGLEYCNSDSVRSLLISQGWLFSGDSLNCISTSISESEKRKVNFEIYPNPTTGIINLSSVNQNQKLQVYNNLGEVVFDGRINSTTQEVDLTHLENGIYFLKYGEQSKKLIIQK